MSFEFQLLGGGRYKLQLIKKSLLMDPGLTCTHWECRMSNFYQQDFSPDLPYLGKQHAMPSSWVFKNPAQIPRKLFMFKSMTTINNSIFQLYLMFINNDNENYLASVLCILK